MGIEIGIILAIIAMLSWGFGDFFIQRSVRKIGDWESLFLITSFGAIVLTPFVYKEILTIFLLNSKSLFLLFGTALIILLAALINFEALKEGKLSIVEPVWSIEVIAGTILSFIVLKEFISSSQIIIIFLLIFSLILVSLKSYHLEKKIWFEKAVFITVIGAVLMGSSTFLMGWGARETNPLIINWFVDMFMALACFIYLAKSGSPLKKIKNAIKGNTKPILGMCLFDKIAWIALTYAMVLAPISIAYALSEGYILIAVLLGMYENKEKLRIHQKIGLVIAIASAVYLATIS